MCFGFVVGEAKSFVACFHKSGLPPTGQLLFALMQKVTKKSSLVRR